MGWSDWLYELILRWSKPRAIPFLTNHHRQIFIWPSGNFILNMTPSFKVILGVHRLLIQSFPFLSVLWNWLCKWWIPTFIFISPLIFDGKIDGLFQGCDKSRVFDLITSSANFTQEYVRANSSPASLIEGHSPSLRAAMKQFIINIRISPYWAMHHCCLKWIYDVARHPL